MARGEKKPFYDPVPPSYDEALAGSSSLYNADDYFDDTDRQAGGQTESQSLLRRPGESSSSAGAAGASSSSSARPPRGYHAPTVETDDEDSLLGSDSEDGEEAQVRRELEEMDVEEPGSRGGSRIRNWGKRIPFNIKLPQWKWSWRPRLPRIQLPQRAPVSQGEDGGEAGEGIEENTERRWVWPAAPKIDRMTAVIVAARIIALMIILGFVWLLFASDMFGGLSQQMGGGFRYNPEDLRVHIQKSVDPMRMRASVMHYSAYAHLAGTEGDFATALDMESMFSKAGLEDIQMDKYFVYLNYPSEKGRAVEIVEKEGGKATWKAKIDEDERGEETAGHQTFSFHGMSKTGDVTGRLIYANYGSREDFRWLQDNGIETKGAIALVRYYGTQMNRALKVKAAEEAGFIGCLIYSDPADDGFKRGTTAPHGRFMPADGVQSGSVALGNYIVGDVLTPGWESLEGTPRMKLDETPALVGIPSLPLAWRDAQKLLQELQDKGLRVDKEWNGAVPDVDAYWSGNLTASPLVHLKNEQDYVENRPIWNVYGRIQGSEQSAKSLIIGNHRDSVSFGATSPNSGTAVLVELARIFGDLLDRGWRPLRTIEFMSWDAAEYNLMGSTEYVEKNIDGLRKHAYAYINLDAAVTGDEFHIAGSPVFSKTVMHAMNRVIDPQANITLKELWDRKDRKMESLGSGSDFVAFQDLAGTASLDLSFRSDAPRPLGSSHDNFDLVEKIIDPDFQYHGLLAQIIGLITLDLADRAIIPFDLPHYGSFLKHAIEDLFSFTASLSDNLADVSSEPSLTKLGLEELRQAGKKVKERIDTFAGWEAGWDGQIMKSGGWESQELGVERWGFNAKMGYFETELLDLELGGGIPNRTQFKHVVYGPSLWDGYQVSLFPAIRDSLAARDWDLAGEKIKKAAERLRAAGDSLQFE